MPLLPPEFLEQVRERNRIEDVMQGYVTLKRAGHNLKCLCPFHSEKTPSCLVYPDTNSFYCFGCGAGGDVITFISKIENLDYIESVRLLASRAGLTLPEDGLDDRAERLKKRLIEINKTAAKYFYRNLRTDEGKEGLIYLLQKRRLTPEIIKKFGLGVAPNHWTGLKNHMLANGFTEQELIEASLLTEKNGRTFDFFVNRVIFPIFDLRGNVIAFSGRTLEANPKGMKYLNSRETMLYKKSRTLFALNFAKNDSVKTKRLILCEGNVDVISLHQAGFTEAVATCGTAITSDHARLMSQYCNEVYICYDADEAGRKATKSAIQILSAAGLNAKIVKVSGDGIKDVDDYLRVYGADHFRVLLNGSAGATDYELATAKSGLDINDSLGKVEYLKRSVDILAAVENPIEREVYISKTAAEQGVSKQIISEQVNAAIKKKNGAEHKKEWRNMTSGIIRDDINPDAKNYPKQARAEESIIAYVCANPDSAGSVFSSLAPDEFVTEFNRKVYAALKINYEMRGDCDPWSLGGEFSTDEMGRISSIIARSREITVDSRVLDDCVRLLKKGVEKTEAGDMSDEEFQRYFTELSKSKKD